MIERFNSQDLLKQYYDISRACVENNEEKTQLFKVINGVKQGGIISPFLFNIYIDELIVSCLSLNLGSKLCEFNTSVISFCDDLNILSPSLKQGQQLLDICSAYGEKWKIKFNLIQNLI